MTAPASARASRCRRPAARPATSPRVLAVLALAIAALSAGAAGRAWSAAGDRSAPTDVALAAPRWYQSVANAAGVTDEDLAGASAGRTVRVGHVAERGRTSVVPLEVYLAQVVSGEAEPGASDAAVRALAVAARTYVVANLGRHGADGFDVCDTTHCQVPRGASTGSRRTALATAGVVLLHEGAPAEVFYSASCGGRSEGAEWVWARAPLPYLRVAADDVHDGDQPWTYEITFADAHAALRRAGVDGPRLEDVRIDGYTDSGRAARIRLAGLEPGVIGGDRFRMALGATRVRSTAFSLERMGDRLRFVGQGYGHGVGLCVVGAGRRAARGETMDAILAHYYPGLTLARLD